MSVHLAYTLARNTIDRCCHSATRDPISGDSRPRHLHLGPMFDVILKTGGATMVVLRGAKLATATDVARQHAMTRKGVFIRNQETGALEQIS